MSQELPNSKDIFVTASLSNFSCIFWAGLLLEMARDQAKLNISQNQNYFPKQNT